MPASGSESLQCTGCGRFLQTQSTFAQHIRYCAEYVDAQNRMSEHRDGTSTLHGLSGTAILERLGVKKRKRKRRRASPSDDDSPPTPAVELPAAGPSSTGPERDDGDPFVAPPTFDNNQNAAYGSPLPSSEASSHRRDPTRISVSPPPFDASQPQDTFNDVVGLALMWSRLSWSLT